MKVPVEVYPLIVSVFGASLFGAYIDQENYAKILVFGVFNRTILIRENLRKTKNLFNLYWMEKSVFIDWIEKCPEYFFSQERYI